MLTSLQNPLIKQMRKLHQPKGRREQQLFLLEGTHLLEEAYAARYPLAAVCYTLDWYNRHPELYQQLEGHANRIELVSPEVLQAIATTVNPDGIVAAAHRGSLPALPPFPVNLGIALETVQDPGNLGTILRTAAATEVDGIWLNSHCVDLDHPKVLRATAGQWFRLPIGTSPDLAEAIDHVQRAGVQVIATLPNAPLPYWEVDLRQPSLILVGNEGAGLSPHLSAMADIQTQIPLAEGVESLNVAIATALILYEAKRQRAYGS